MLYEGESGGGNPWEQFGKGAGGGGSEEGRGEGEGKPEPKPEDKIELTRAQYTELTTKLGTAEAKLAKLPDDFAGMSEKIKIVDRMVKAFSGDEGDKTTKAYGAVFDDLMEVSKHAAPGFYNLMKIMRDNPDAVDQLTKSIDMLHAERVININTQAHDRIVKAAKTFGFTAKTPEALAKMVFPFEVSVTQIINSKPELKRAFLQGNVSVVDDIFKELADPYVQERRARNADRLQTRTFPKAPPRGSAEPGATGNANKENARPNYRDPKQRAEFHKGAVNRWLDKVSNREEE